MPSVEFADEASADLASIVDYTIERWGSDQARRYLSGLRESCAELAQMPGLGKEASWLAPGLRCFPYGSHVIYYAEREDGIAILAVVHKRQVPERRLQT